MTANKQFELEERLREWAKLDDINLADFLDIWQIRMIAEFIQAELDQRTREVVEIVESCKSHSFYPFDDETYSMNKGWDQALERVISQLQSKYLEKGK